MIYRKKFESEWMQKYKYWHIKNIFSLKHKKPSDYNGYIFTKKQGIYPIETLKENSFLSSPTRKFIAVKLICPKCEKSHSHNREISLYSLTVFIFKLTQ